MDNNFNKDIQEEEGFDFKSFFISCIKHWYYFAITLLLCVAYAYYNVTYTSPIYRIQSVLLIDDNAGKSSQKDLFDLDMLGGNKNIDNELEILKSRTLVSKAVERLDFDVSYFWIGNVTVNELYDNSPFKVKSDSLFNCIGVFEINILNQNSFKLKHIYAEDLLFEGKYFFGELIKSPSGEFTVYKSDFFDSRNFGDFNLKSKSRNFKFKFNDRESIVNKYLSSLRVELVGKRSSVVNLSITDQVKQKGIDFLNALIEEYRIQGVSNKNEVTLNTINFIKERLAYITEDLEMLETNIENFKSENRITSLGEESKMFLSNVSRYDADLSLVNMKLNLMDNLQKKIKLNETLSDYSPSLIGIEDPLLQKLVMQLSELEFQKEKLITTSKSQSPLLFTSNIEVQIKKTKAAIGESVNKIKESLLISQADLKKIIGKQEDFIRAIPKVSRELISIERQQEIKEKLYIYLLEKQEEAAVSQAATVSDCRVLDKAEADNTPVKPIKSLVYLMALVAGFVVPAVLLALKNFFNNKVLNIADIEKYTNGTPIIGKINQTENKNNLVISSQSKTAISEQFRSIRTNLQYFSGGKTLKTILITSSMGGEGKTFIATNIAASLAMAGKKTILLEFDLRKPKLLKGLGMTSDMGLSNFLVGLVNLSDIIKNTDVNENLHVISSGPIPPNPSELILLDKMELLMNQLKDQYDCIVIDSPPVGLVTDGFVLSRFADSSLFVVRQSITDCSQLILIRDIYNRRHLTNLSIIFNGLNKGIGNYGYGEKYGQGYGNSYYEEEKSTDHSVFKRIKQFFTA